MTPCLSSSSAWLAIVQRELGGGQPDRNPRRLGQEFVAVGPGVGGHRPDPALVEEIGLVLEPRDRRHVDAGQRQRPAPGQVAQGDRHQLAGGREEDRALGAVRHRRRATSPTQAAPSDCASSRWAGSRVHT